MANNYERLDELIISALSDKPKTFGEIWTGDVYQECIKHDRVETARVLDRRLQALRKKGLIIFAKGWRKLQTT